MAVGRRLAGLGIAVLVLAATAVGCGSSSSSSPRPANNGCGTACGNAGPAASPAPAGSAANPAQLGCHQYCQQAGGYGGGPQVLPPTMKIVSPKTVTVPSSGSVPVTVECRISAPCRGAILIDFAAACSSPGEGGRSDLDVAAQSTRTIGVPLSRCQHSLLNQRGQVQVGLVADSGQAPDCRKYDCVVFSSLILRRPA